MRGEIRDTYVVTGSVVAAALMGLVLCALSIRRRMVDRKATKPLRG